MKNRRFDWTFWVLEMAIIGAVIWLFLAPTLLSIGFTWAFIGWLGGMGIAWAILMWREHERKQQK